MTMQLWWLPSTAYSLLPRSFGARTRPPVQVSKAPQQVVSTRSTAKEHATLEQGRRQKLPPPPLDSRAAAPREAATGLTEAAGRLDDEDAGAAAAEPTSAGAHPISASNLQRYWSELKQLVSELPDNEKETFFDMCSEYEDGQLSNQVQNLPLPLPLPLPQKQGAAYAAAWGSKYNDPSYWQETLVQPLYHEALERELGTRDYRLLVRVYGQELAATPEEVDFMVQQLSGSEKKRMTTIMHKLAMIEAEMQAEVDPRAAEMQRRRRARVRMRSLARRKGLQLKEERVRDINTPARTSRLGSKRSSSRPTRGLRGQDGGGEEEEGEEEEEEGEGEQGERRAESGAAAESSASSSGRGEASKPGGGPAAFPGLLGLSPDMVKGASRWVAGVWVGRMGRAHARPAVGLMGHSSNNNKRPILG